MNTREYFDKEAATWNDDITSGDRSTEDYDALVYQLGVRRGDTVVDVGSGTGVMIPFLLERVGKSGRIIAVDISPEMVRHIRARFSANNLEVLCECASDLSINDASCNSIMCFAALPHFPNKQKCFQEFRRILVDNGALLIAHFSSREAINKRHREIGDFMKHHMLPPGDELTDMLTCAGFTDISVEDREDRFRVRAVARPRR